MSSPKNKGRRQRVKVQEDAASKRSFSARIRTYFLTGVVVAAPISITIYLTWLFVVTVDRRITPLIPANRFPDCILLESA
ncbi:MAG: hypothetical protein AAF337_10735, partial [Pseudomonadota bacterium]